nr:hypothetical protein [uncultured Albidiferax sp.]
MNASVNFSIFVGDGSAFGMATATVAAAPRPMVGDVVQLACVDCHPELNFVDGFPLTVEAVDVENTPPHILARDVVLATQGDAWRLIEYLLQVGADCDVWGWTKIGATWKKDEQSATDRPAEAGPA